MLRGTPKFDGLALGEGSFNFLSPTTSLRAKAAFINNGTGQTHGWTEATGGWSKETMQALAALRASIENDLGVVHLSDVQDSLETSEGSSFTGAPSGIGEHLNDPDAPQI